MVTTNDRSGGQSRSGRQRVRIAVLCAALVVAVASAIALGVHRSRPPAPAASETTVQEVGQSWKFTNLPVLLFVSDAYPAETIDNRNVTYPSLVARDLGWALDLDASAGNGYLAAQSGETNSPTIDLQHCRPNFVIVDIGRNDLAAAPEAVVPAVTDYLLGLRNTLPDATVFVVVPAQVEVPTTSNYGAISASINDAAMRTGAVVVDPVYEQWFSGFDTSPFVNSDGSLTVNGHFYYAQRLSDTVHRLLAPRTDLWQGVTAPSC